MVQGKQTWKSKYYEKLKRRYEQLNRMRKYTCTVPGPDRMRGAIRTGISLSWLMAWLTLPGLIASDTLSMKSNGKPARFRVPLFETARLGTVPDINSFL